VADILLILPVLLFSVVAHEYAHAWTAFRQGDDTARRLGRLTMHPLPHLDLVNSIVMPIGLWVLSNGAFTFGAARPVPVNPANYRHPRRGDFIVSLAGVTMNLLLVLAGGLLFAAFGLLGQFVGAGGVFHTLQRMASAAVTVNLLLGFFNLLPLPPLDGSHVLAQLLPPAWREGYRSAGRVGFAALLLAMVLVPRVGATVFWPVSAMTDIARGLLAPFALAGGGS
jgi:Zn-dependent protease